MGRLPPKKKGSKLAAEMPEQAKEAEKAFYRCPSGHSLPHRTSAGNCTPLYCTSEEAKKREKVDRDAKKADRGEPSDLAMLPASPAGKEVKLADEEEREITALERARRREKARREMVRVPEGLKGGDAEAWTAAKLVELSPLAAAEMELQLRFGDPEQRWRAAQRVLDSTGHGKKDIATGGATIIINATGGINIPWLKPRQVEGQVVGTKPISSLEQGIVVSKEPSK